LYKSFKEYFKENENITFDCRQFRICGYICNFGGCSDDYDSDNRKSLRYQHHLFSDQKEGITKFSNALKQLDTEMGPRYKELETMGTQAQALAKEITTLRETLAANPKAPIKPEDVQAKADKFQQMQIDFKRKEEDTKQAVGRRSQALLDPIRFDIYKVMQDFAKQKNYPIILDVAKLDEQNLILAIGDEKVDLTKEFIAFYNARPATAATTATK
jgi:Skp family chaperone for outer membrane proteins